MLHLSICVKLDQKNEKHPAPYLIAGAFTGRMGFEASSSVLALPGPMRDIPISRTSRKGKNKVKYLGEISCCSENPHLYIPTLE